jgi:beta-fructofuranosidase
VGGSTWRMPYADGPVRVVVDGPIIEVSSRAGVLAAAIRPAGDSLSVEADGDLELHDLRR